MSKMASSKSKKSKEIKEEVEDTVNDEETTRLDKLKVCLLYTSPSPRDRQKSRMPSSA